MEMIWAHVNPIPLNPIEGSKWTASKPEDERRFLEILHNAGITATLRDTRGQDIDAHADSLQPKNVTDSSERPGSVRYSESA